MLEELVNAGTQVAKTDTQVKCGGSLAIKSISVTVWLVYKAEPLLLDLLFV